MKKQMTNISEALLFIRREILHEYIKNMILLDH